MKYFKIIYFIIFTLFLFSCEIFYQDPSKMSYKETQTQLNEGTLPNSFNFRIDGKVYYSREPASYSMVGIYLKRKKNIFQIKSDNNNKFSIDVDLYPGEYTILSEIPKEENSKDYWAAFGGNLTLSSNGVLNFKQQIIFHKLNMRTTSPVELAKIKSKRTTLKWEPIDGASYYVVAWFEISKDKERKVIQTKQNLRTPIPEYTFQIDLVPNREYGWGVRAYDKEDNNFAYYSQSTFYTKSTLE